jgi:hypothetical protein
MEIGNMRFAIAAFMAMAICLSGCVTTEGADGTSETRFDAEAYGVILSTADAWVGMADQLLALYERTEEEPDPSMLDQILGRSDEILDFVDRLDDRGILGAQKRSAPRGPEAVLAERVRDVRARALAMM